MLERKEELSTLINELRQLPEEQRFVRLEQFGIDRIAKLLVDTPTPGIIFFELTWLIAYSHQEKFIDQLGSDCISQIFKDELIIDNFDPLPGSIITKIIEKIGINGIVNLIEKQKLKGKKLCELIASLPEDSWEKFVDQLGHKYLSLIFNDSSRLCGISRLDCLPETRRVKLLEKFGIERVSKLITRSPFAVITFCRMIELLPKESWDKFPMAREYVRSYIEDKIESSEFIHGKKPSLSKIFKYCEEPKSLFIVWEFYSNKETMECTTQNYKQDQLQVETEYKAEPQFKSELFINDDDFYAAVKSRNIVTLQRLAENPEACDKLDLEKCEGEPPQDVFDLVLEDPWKNKEIIKMLARIIDLKKEQDAYHHIPVRILKAFLDNYQKKHKTIDITVVTKIQELFDTADMSPVKQFQQAYSWMKAALAHYPHTKNHLLGLIEILKFIDEIYPKIALEFMKNAKSPLIRNLKGTTESKAVQQTIAPPQTTPQIFSALQITGETAPLLSNATVDTRVEPCAATPNQANEPAISSIVTRNQELEGKKASHNRIGFSN